MPAPGADALVTGRRLALAIGARRHALFRRLAMAGKGDPNDIAVAGMCATWATGGGALPQWMGLPPAMFRKMLRHHFGAAGKEIGGGRIGASPDRYNEIADLRDLLLKHRAQRVPSERWLVEMIATGCMGPDHLWSDLGLMSRPELSRLMGLNFPCLADQNVHNMRWKRFLYKKLCESEGWYICRAPTCQECSEYTVCYAPHDA